MTAHWLHALAMHGHKTALCTSWQAARDVLLDYLADAPRAELTITPIHRG